MRNTSSGGFFNLQLKVHDGLELSASLASMQGFNLDPCLFTRVTVPYGNGPVFERLVVNGDASGYTDLIGTGVSTPNGPASIVHGDNARLPAELLVYPQRKVVHSILLEQGENCVINGDNGGRQAHQRVILTVFL